MVVPGSVFVAHQLLVTVSGLPRFSRLGPVPTAVFAVNRLKLMVSGPAMLKAPAAMPPPLPVEELPVIVTLVSVAD